MNFINDLWFHIFPQVLDTDFDCNLLLWSQRFNKLSLLWINFADKSNFPHKKNSIITWTLYLDSCKTAKTQAIACLTFKHNTKHQPSTSTSQGSERQLIAKTKLSEMLTTIRWTNMTWSTSQHGPAWIKASRSLPGQASLKFLFVNKIFVSLSYIAKLSSSVKDLSFLHKSVNVWTHLSNVCQHYPKFSLELWRPFSKVKFFFINFSGIMLLIGCQINFLKSGKYQAMTASIECPSWQQTNKQSKT